MIPKRDYLPARRRAETVEFEHRGLGYTASVGFYPDGRLGEAFLDGVKAGTDAQINAKDGAVFLSIALQYGVPLAVLRHAAARDDAGAPQGPLGALLDGMSSLRLPATSARRCGEFKQRFAPRRSAMLFTRPDTPVGVLHRVSADFTIFERLEVHRDGPVMIVSCAPPHVQPYALIVHMNSSACSRK